MVLEEKLFKECGRRTDDGRQRPTYHISSPVSLRLRSSKKSQILIVQKCCQQDSACILSWTFAGDQDRHKIVDEFEFWPDPAVNFGVNTLEPQKKNVMDTIACFIFDRIFVRIVDKEDRQYNHSQLCLLPPKLLALDRRNISHWHIKILLLLSSPSEATVLHRTFDYNYHLGKTDGYENNSWVGFIQ